MQQEQLNNPLQGVTLLKMLEFLIEKHGWETLGEKIPIRCFTHNPSLKSSLAFLRKTPWAREKVERLYLRSL
ncbi:MAG: VF530 family protein [Flavobacteriaceae bacterium]